MSLFRILHAQARFQSRWDQHTVPAIEARRVIVLDYRLRLQYPPPQRAGLRRRHSTASWAYLLRLTKLLPSFVALGTSNDSRLVSHNLHPTLPATSPLFYPPHPRQCPPL